MIEYVMRVFRFVTVKRNICEKTRSLWWCDYLIKCLSLFVWLHFEICPKERLSLTQEVNINRHSSFMAKKDLETSVHIRMSGQIMAQSINSLMPSRNFFKPRNGAQINYSLFRINLFSRRVETRRLLYSNLVAECQSSPYRIDLIM